MSSLRSLFGALSLIPTIVLSAGAQSSKSGPRLEAPSFVFARYASGSASALYAVRGFGRIGGLVAMVQSPETRYRELIVGSFTQLNWNRQSVLVALAYADATESQYLQAYVAPSFAVGRLSLSGTIEWYEPLGRAGTRQLGVNPASLELRVNDHLWLGGAYTLSVAENEIPQHRGGPVLEWVLGRSTLRLELLGRTDGKPVEVRTAVLATF
jgi:hypothetical protein